LRAQKKSGPGPLYFFLFYDQPRSATPMKAMIDALLELLRVLVDFEIAFFTLTAYSRRHSECCERRERPTAVIQMQTTAVKMVLTKNSTLSFPFFLHSPCSRCKKWAKCQ